MQYISVEKKDVALKLSKLFFYHTLLNTITCLGENISSSSFLAHSQSSIEVRHFSWTNFIKLLLSDYAVYGILFGKNFVIFDRLSLK